MVFKDGTFIALEDLVIEDLTPEQRHELDDLHLYNELAIRKRLHELGNTSQNILNSLTLMRERFDAFDDFKRTQKLQCPINPTAIEQIVDEHVITSKIISEFLEVRWWDIFKRKVVSAGNIAKAILAILALLGAFIIVKGALQ